MNYKFYYGTDTDKIEITNKVKEIDFIPNGDLNRANIFGDPLVGTLKSIYIEHSDGTFFKYSDRIKINTITLETEEIVYPVIVAIAKLESNYIKEWVKYHLSLGFKKIYLYDNEDIPTYEKLLNNEHVIVTHIPGNNYHKPVQYLALDFFISDYMKNGVITHCIHIDIDEFIVLKKHNSIKDFIKEYIYGETIGIGINWKFFGDSFLTHETSEPVTQRFTRCQLNCNNHIKTLFDVSKTPGWSVCHSIYIPENYYVKCTNGTIINDAFNDNYDDSVIQLNHYKCKTFSEFKYIRTRGRADLIGNQNEIVEDSFNAHNFNESEDFHAYDFYKNIKITEYLNSKGFYSFEGYSQEIPEQVNDLRALSKGKKYILEIGFNAGHSSCIFLENDCIVVSFDLGSHDYVQTAKEYIDIHFLGKHTLILGDSTTTIPKYKSDIKFDIIFIDGGHDYNIVKDDIKNCERFAHKDTIFVVDDITYNTEYHYTIGPTKIWNQYVKSGKMIQIRHKEYTIGRGMAWGKLNDLIIYYGTKNNKINITDMIIKNYVKNNCIYIPNGDHNRANMFGDPLVGTLKSIFINETEYHDYTKIFIENGIIYQIDDIPEKLKMFDE